MKRLLYIMILLTLAGFSQSASATIWSWIDSSTNTNGQNYTYQFTIASWDTNDSTVNPCYGESVCTLFIGHKHNTNGTSGSTADRYWGSNTYPWIITSETIGELGENFKQNSGISFPYSSTTAHTGDINFNECVTFFYTPTLRTAVFTGNSPLPSTICGVAPPPVGTCGFNQDTVTIDHGTLSKSSLDGNIATNTITVTCSAQKDISLYIYGGDHLNLKDDGSLYSMLYLDEYKSESQGLKITVNDSEIITVKSQLVTNGSVEAGEFAGSAVVVLSID